MLRYCLFLLFEREDQGCPLLATYLLDRYATEHGPSAFSSDALDKLKPISGWGTSAS